MMTMLGAISAKSHSISKSVQLQFVQDKDDWLRECLYESKY